MKQFPKPFPEPGSLLSSEAARWYLESVREIPAHIGRDRSPRELLEAAYGLKARLRLAAAQALVDPLLIEEFLRKLPLPAIESLVAQGGDDAEHKALVKVLSITELERRAFPGTVGEAIGLEVSDGRGGAHVMTESGWQVKEEGGFPPGFPVKTPTGFKRIEQVQAGDVVLSTRPDGSGTPEPKRVLRTLKRENRTLVNTATIVPGTQGGAGITANGATLFWVEDRGWTRLDGIDPTGRVRTLDGPAEFMASCWPVYRTTRAGIGWVQAMRNTEESWGSLFDYANYAPVRHDGQAYLEPEVWESEERFLRLAVHDLEVEDFNTYYVSGHLVRSA